MQRNLTNVLAILNEYSWPDIELVWDQESFDYTLDSQGMVRYLFRSFNKEFTIDFHSKPMPGYYKTEKDRKMSGLPPVTYHELFFYFMFAYSTFYSNATLDDYYEFIEAWARGMVLDMNSYFAFKDELENVITPVLDADR